MSKYDENNELRCSFCGKPQSQVKRLISGSGVYICNECVALCQDILASEEHHSTVQGEAVGSSTDRLPRPKEIANTLSEVCYWTGRCEKSSGGSSVQPL